MPFHIRTRERIEDKPVEGLRLSEDDPPFTMVELKAVLRVKSEKGSGTRRPDGRYLHSGDRERDGSRIQWHMLPSLSPKQYGFMPQRSTEDALYDLVNHVKRR
ncbi:hypothetical protein EVAR_57860_1 [Eumeta japonica]|uniref:Uncharacterized protein n=1 Tax=Eumeta variegata TaxID=151549 RepID=A0A4C1ZC48_EUMVA|nr:hypothetical protein EVAR_57860_1 [Eumeta japonica]